ncbi:MAG: phosphoribosylglycinamide formyltransferase [Chitinophagaceae bacterium]
MGQADKIHIAIFASGAGSNAANLIRYFQGHPTILTSLIVCNKPEAGVLSIAAENHVATLLIEKERFFRGDAYVPLLQQQHIDFIVLAGFLWKIPLPLIQAYPNKIVNIHPALLPKYGGKGMYGVHVHNAIVTNKEKETGITIHIVDEIYDNGKVLFQTSCPVAETDTADDIAAHVHALEYAHFPEQVEKWIEEMLR